jgi:hypothetical protein
MKPVPKNCSAITRKMATPIISGPNPWSVAVHLLVGVLAPSVVLRAGEDTLASYTGG